MSAFSRRVISVVRRIPPGRVATYGDVAKAAGQPGAARAVGNIMSHLTERGVPAHRVIAAGGRLGGFGGNVEMKRALLRAEGVLVGSTTVRNFAKLRWPSASAAAQGREGPEKPSSKKPARRGTR
jgi:methylated-DNA-[protein]-cysteine S-methyltransferase